ncbi:MAG: hypothetical protein LBD31_10865 [Treponema sp.]|jgi:hypothetical protein|nr:hypothetical protein [Treponema sp.]
MKGKWGIASGEGARRPRSLAAACKAFWQAVYPVNRTGTEKAPANIKENALLLDAATLTFGSFILGGILRRELPHYILIAAGNYCSGRLCRCWACVDFTGSSSNKEE